MEEDNTDNGVTITLTFMSLVTINVTKISSMHTYGSRPAKQNIKLKVVVLRVSRHQKSGGLSLNP